jgi:hypothetical protein
MAGWMRSRRPQLSKALPCGDAAIKKNLIHETELHPKNPARTNPILSAGKGGAKNDSGRTRRLRPGGSQVFRLALRLGSSTLAYVWIFLIFSLFFLLRGAGGRLRRGARRGGESNILNRGGGNFILRV